MRTLLCFSLLLVAVLAQYKKTDKRSLEIVQPNFYNTFPSQGISVFNSGTSGLKSGVVAGNSLSFGSTISPAIAYNSAGHLFSSGVFGSNGFIAGGPVVGGFDAVTPVPAYGSSVVTAAPPVVTAAPSVVTAAPSVVTAAPPVVTAAPAVVSSTPFPETFGAHLGLGYSGLNAGFLDSGLVHSYGAINQPIPVPVPHPVEVPVTKTVAVPVPQPYSVPKPYAVPVGVKVPVAVPKPYEVKVPTKVPVAVPVRVPIEIPRPYPVFKTKEVKVEIERPVYVRTPVPIKVPVPVPYNVEVPQGVKIPVPHQVVLKEPKVYSAGGFPVLGGGFDFNGLAVTPSAPVASSAPFFGGISGFGNDFGAFGSINNIPILGEEITNTDKDSVSVESRSGDKSDEKTDVVSTSTVSPSAETSTVSSEDFSSAFTSGSLFSETDAADVSTNVKESETPSEQLVNVLEDSSDKSTTEPETESS